MRRLANFPTTHYWTVREPGLSRRQWHALGPVFRGALEKAQHDGVVVQDVVDNSLAIGFRDENPRGEPFLFTRVPMNQSVQVCRTESLPYDLLVRDVLTAAKKIAPDIVMLSAYGDPEPMRHYASQASTDDQYFRKGLIDLLAKVPGIVRAVEADFWYDEFVRIEARVKTQGTIPLTIHKNHGIEELYVIPNLRQISMGVKRAVDTYVKNLKAYDGSVVSIEAMLPIPKYEYQDPIDRARREKRRGGYDSNVIVIEVNR